MKVSLNNTALLLLLAPAAAGEPAVRAQYIMGTVCEIAAEAPEAAVSAAFAEIRRWDGILSLYKKDSEASRLNGSAAAGPVAVSAELWEAVSASLEAARRSDGAFDPTARAGRTGGWTKIRLDRARRSVFFAEPGLRLDFGGIGKGIALDHAARLLREGGVRSARINFGGQIYALGAWEVSVPGHGALRVADASVSTSGNSEQPGHIIDPADGRRLYRRRSVTVVAPTAAQADAWDTALFVNPALLPRLCRGCRAYFGDPS